MTMLICEESAKKSLCQLRSRLSADGRLWTRLERANSPYFRREELREDDKL